MFTKLLKRNDAIEALRSVVEQGETRRKQLAAIAQRGQQLEADVTRLYRVMTEQRDVKSCEAWIAATITANQTRELWEKASIACRTAEAPHTAKLLAPKVTAALEEIITRLNGEREAVIEKEREIADGIGATYSPASSAVVKQLDDALARAERHVADVRAGDAGAVQSAARFCLS